VIAVEPPPLPPRWTVRLGKGQQDKAKRQAVYDALRRHRVEHPVASQAANAFHSGGVSEAPLPDAETARSVVADLQALGIAAEVVDPQPSRRAGESG